MNGAAAPPPDTFGRILAIAVMLQVGYGIMFPVIPLRPAEILGTDDQSDSAGAWWHGFTTFLSGLLGMFLAPPIGSLSDVHGRRPLLALTAIAAAAEAAMSGLADDIYIFSFGRMIGGLAQTYWSVVIAAVIDVSTPETKSTKIGVLMGLTMGLGFVVGPILGGFLGQSTVHGPYLAACTTSLLAAALSMTIIPETAPLAVAQGTDKEKPPTGSGEGEGEGDAMLRAAPAAGAPAPPVVLNPLQNLTLLGKSRSVVVLSIVCLVSSMAVQGFAACGILYLDYKFKWSKQELGVHMGLLGLSFLVSQAMVLPIVAPRARAVDIAIASAAWGVGTGIVYAAIVDPDLLFWMAALVGPVGISGVVVISMISDEFPADVQGRVSGCLLLLDRLARILGAVTLTSMFAALTDGDHDFPEIVPLTLSLFTCVSGVVLLSNRQILLARPTASASKAS